MSMPACQPLDFTGFSHPEALTHPAHLVRRPPPATGERSAFRGPA